MVSLKCNVKLPLKSSPRRSPFIFLLVDHERNAESSAGDDSPSRRLRARLLPDGASIVLIQFLGALKVVPLTNLLVRPKAGATP
jgi:hypothetical protein